MCVDGLDLRCFFVMKPFVLLDQILPEVASPMKIREVFNWLRRDGWVVVRIKGSYRQLRHFMKAGFVIVAGYFNDDLVFGTLRSILRQADLEEG
jgi:predicted RNA binding protein YcfA (HicA-like mRNA interferase family)